MREQKEKHEKELVTALENTLKTKLDEQKDDMKCQMGECYNKLLNLVNESDTKSREEDKKIHKEIDVIKDGMLSVQGTAFKNECRKLLDQKEPITLEQYEAMVEEHHVYNSLGGNHTGDALFKSLEAKYIQGTK